MIIRGASVATSSIFLRLLESCDPLIVESHIYRWIFQCKNDWVLVLFGVVNSISRRIIDETNWLCLFFVSAITGSVVQWMPRDTSVLHQMSLALRLRRNGKWRQVKRISQCSIPLVVITENSRSGINNDNRNNNQW